MTKFKKVKGMTYDNTTNDMTIENITVRVTHDTLGSTLGKELYGYCENMKKLSGS